MRELFSKALQESLRPHLEGNSRHIGLLEETIEENAAALGPAAGHYRSRAHSLRVWNEKALALLPLLDMLSPLLAPFLPFNLVKSDSASEPDSKTS